jgi:hypothetical protein
MHPDLEDFLLARMSLAKRKGMELGLRPDVEEALLTKLGNAHSGEMKRYAELVKAHGTLVEFTTAVKNAIGEISVAEADAAILKYRQDLAAALAADMADIGPETMCRCCLGPNVTWHAPNELWNRVMRKEGEGSEPYNGLICLACFASLAEQDGVDVIWQLQPADPWRPMKTAPKDGTEIILVVEKRAGIPYQKLVGHWMPGGHCIDDHPPIAEGWYFWNGCMFDKASKPLAWMPIPVYKPKGDNDDAKKTL